MKRVEAIIRPHKLDEVLEAIGKSGLSGVTVLETQGFGHQLGHSEVYRGVESEYSLVPKRMLVMYVSEKKVDELVKLINDVAQTGKIGDGKIAVVSLDNIIRIRTGEEGRAAV